METLLDGVILPDDDLVIDCSIAGSQRLLRPLPDVVRPLLQVNMTGSHVRSGVPKGVHNPAAGITSMPATHQSEGHTRVPVTGSQPSDAQRGKRDALSHLIEVDSMLECSSQRTSIGHALPIECEKALGRACGQCGNPPRGLPPAF